MRFDLTVNEFTMELITKKHLKVFGEQFWRPYVHVFDAARGIRLVLESPKESVSGRVFNVGATDQNFQKQQLVELIRPYAPDAVVEYVHKDEDPRDYRVCFAKFRVNSDTRLPALSPKASERSPNLWVKMSLEILETQISELTPDRPGFDGWSRQ